MLQQHLKVMHEKIIHQCPLCNQPFNHQGSIRRHLRVFHEKLTHKKYSIKFYNFCRKSSDLRFFLI